MLDIQQTIRNLIGLDVTDDFKNDIICAFDTTENEIIVSKDESNPNIDYQAYENNKNASIICIRIKNEKIIDAWEE
jgi:hypothetical protein